MRSPRPLLPLVLLLVGLGASVVLRLFFPAAWERLKLALLLFVSLVLIRVGWSTLEAPTVWGGIALLLLGPAVVLAWRDAYRRSSGS